MAEARLVARVETKGAKKAAGELDKFAKEAGKSERATKKLGAILKKAPKALAAVGAAASAATIAIAAIAIRSAESQRELQALANVAGTSAADFAALAFATDTVGISAEKLADISKDTNEKLGEFIATGGGGFKDFFEEVAPLVGVTANELQNLSGPEVLQRVKNAMDEANISMEEQSFFLESIASDTTLLIPLLEDEGAKLDSLASKYRAVSEAIKITGAEKQSLAELAETFKLLETQSGKAATSISAALAPTLDELFKETIRLVPQATQAVVDFINVFVNSKNLTDLGVAQNRLFGVNEEIAKLRERLAGPRQRGQALIGGAIERLQGEADDLEATIARLLEQNNNLDEARRTFEQGREQGTKGGLSNTVDADATISDPTAFLAQLEKLGMSRLELIKTQQQERIDTLESFNLIELGRVDEFETAKTQIIDDAARQRQDILDQERASTLAANEELFGTLADVAGEFAGRQSGVFKALFAVQKSFALASAINNIALAQSQAAADGTAITPAQKISNVALITSQLVGIISTISSSSFSARQQGGQFSAGQNLLVGEKGPELVQFGAGGRIASNQDTQGLLGQSTNVTVINQTSGRIDEVETRQGDRGEMILIVKEVLSNEVRNPNSRFNSDLDQTRQVERRL